MATVQHVAQAIAKCEGFGIPGAVPTTANNPGDLTYSGNYQTRGFANDEGVVNFVSLADGWAALYHQCYLILSGKSEVYSLTMTIAEMGLKYSGGDPNWAISFAKQFNVPTTTTIQQLAELPEAI